MKARPPTRYFYTDPLAAAWMARHFEMQFKSWRWNNLNFEFQQTRVGPVPDCSRLYVHPDSLHLFDPQVGDLVLFTRAARDEDYDGDIGHSGYNIFGNGPFIASEVERIIQRQGKSFIWPESEPVESGVVNTAPAKGR